MSRAKRSRKAKAATKRERRRATFARDVVLDVVGAMAGGFMVALRRRMENRADAITVEAESVDAKGGDA